MIRKIIKSILPASYKRQIQKLILGYNGYTPSFSSSGEDMILNYLFANKLQKREPGFFIDIGAYHPMRFSCTYFFYYNNWRGINIDARPGSMKDFDANRPEDINIEVGVATTDGYLTYYSYPDNDTINTFSPETLNLNKDSAVKTQVKTVPLSDILNNHLPKNQVIDFISVDVEGFELEVLKSNNWEKYRPRIVVIEHFEMDIKKIMASKIFDYMADKGYFMILRTPISIYFADKSVKFDKHSNKIV